ncbi:MAG: alpha/beta fold hydrolase [Chloroflexi bacterium]|nr:alpha/beta fold hydrolase [Chloroflexota bacterium]
MQLALSSAAARRAGNWAWNAAFVAGAATVGGAAGLSWLSRWKVRGLQPHPDPATDYAGALERMLRMEFLDDGSISPVCRTRGLLHGRRTEHAVILVHGLTNCPQQWAPFAELLYARGCNVLLPRMPRHGLADRMTTEPKRLRAEELRDFADRVVDIAAGLGERVTFVGLSAGGIVGAWVSQHRPEVTKSVLIAPSLGFGQYGEWLQLVFMNLMLHLPDVETHHFRRTERAMPYAYVGWSTRALGEVLRLGVATARDAVRQRPATQHLMVVTNANDMAVSNQLTRQLVSIWQSRGLRRVEYYEFDKAQQLEHDLIDPNNPKQRVDLVYPILLDLITREDQAKPLLILP